MVLLEQMLPYQGTNSWEPASPPAPWHRVTPRWSVAGHTAPSSASFAGLPTRSIIAQTELPAQIEGENKDGSKFHADQARPARKVHLELINFE